MNSIHCLLISLACFASHSCIQNSKSAKDEFEHQNKITKFDAGHFKYDSLTIPKFFQSLIENHLNDFFLIDSSAFYRLCNKNDLVRTDSINITRFFTIKLLHHLFTCNSASNCSVGEILDIPYYWHWITPNPRYEIKFVRSSQSLSSTKASVEFPNYRSFADVDRTPYLFLRDLVEEMPKYFSAACDTFSTFGWCSEREMAFVALAKLLNIDGKVVAEGNHSWSEFCVPMKSPDGTLHFIVKVDNTFNMFDWAIIEEPEIEDWKNHFGNSERAKWYNQKAHSNNELNRISSHLVSSVAAQRIENKVVKFLNKKLQQY
ncbi:MAG: hypothetical protein KBF37_09245 [Saprospiraceae bacterium]|jgi:hypothetical protein|nr:hypothetical protein [Saprospiraceae bacterium]MBV6472588.1 hypothetical protein [Saprospiraceae bacterium]